MNDRFEQDPCLMIIAGEVSGDQHGARLVRQLLKLQPGLKLFGMGGERMAAAGLEVIEPIDRTGVVGIWEALRSLGEFRRIFKRLEKAMTKRQPDAVLLIDYPGFNLRFAQKAKSAGIPVIYYICPQVWAWGRWRVRKIKRWVDRLLVIFRFEVDFFRKYGVSADFVGHPLMDEVVDFPDRQSARTALGIDSGLIVGLLPGSRPSEVERIYPILLSSAKIMAQAHPGIEFITPVSSPELKGLLEGLAGQALDSGLNLSLVPGQAREVMAAADLVLVASGTATLETALAHTPMVVVYQVNLLSWLLGKLLVKIPYISLVNIVSGHKVVPEFIQGDASPGRIVAAASELLPGGKNREEMILELKKVSNLLGAGGATELAAREVLKELDKFSRDRDED